MTDDLTCSARSASLDEPVLGTASIVHSWLLVEQPGSWGHDALFESRLPLAVARHLVAQGERHHVRVLLIRRPDRVRSTIRHVFALSSRRHPGPWIEERLFIDPDELLGVDFEALGAGERPASFGAPYRQPLHLVCTNGRHDPCCAQLGRPVIRALSSNRVWESSHVGGERFAANLVCFPHGLYFGRVDPAGAAALVSAYEAGQVDLDNYRGRAGDPFVVQAAEVFLRRQLGLTGVDEVTPVRRHRLDDGLVGVGFTTTDGGRHEVHVAVCPADEARPLTCSAARPERPNTFTLVDVFPLAGPGPSVH